FRLRNTSRECFRRSVLSSSVDGSCWGATVLIEVFFKFRFQCGTPLHLKSTSPVKIYCLALSGLDLVHVAFIFRGLNVSTNGRDNYFKILGASFKFHLLSLSL